MPGQEFSQKQHIHSRKCLLVSNFMQKNKKSCHAVQKIFLKKSILGPKFDLLTPGGPGQEFSCGKHIHRLKFLIIAQLHAKNKKILACSSEAIFEKVQFWAKFDLLTPPRGGQEFFSKIGKSHFLHLCCSKFVKNIKKFWRADPDISALRTDERTDGQS